ncbi:hypothetical protein PP182_00945 [Maribacter sp. PR1]|uniref:Uncharacterized protein n=1 Tax=Maribacter cobaltidurans TaxID=1178778 RepID=A0ABU7INU6_9FLAO|nr:MULTISPECIES: hypothetical protein [Maribacter]MDC6387231.1 hypothetical protein [Maribacter sp. PR1]MEE1974616.1 hypothetical protein [Maribacter cobaltidurans]
MIFILMSCSEKQDFGQYDDLTITPTYETSIFYVKTQESIINRVTGINFFSQDFNFDAFEDDLFAERVLEGSITYQLENTTSKDIEISIQFLDESGNVLDSELFQMNATPSALLTREVAYGGAGKNLDILRNTSEIRLSAENLGDNSSTSNLPDPAIILRSSAKFMVRIK